MEGGVPKMSHGRKKSNRFMGEVQESVFIYRLGGGGEDFEGEHSFQGEQRGHQSSLTEYIKPRRL